MEKLDVTDIEVVDILAKGQKAISAQINEEVENAFVPGVDNLVYFGLVTAFEKNQEQVDWTKFFKIIEEFLHEPQYSLYPDIIKSHVLDILASSAAHQGIDPHYLSFYAGPYAREHFKAWENANKKNAIFKSDRHLNTLDVADYLTEIHPGVHKDMLDHAFEYWDANAPGTVFFGIASAAQAFQNELNWKEFFARIENTLTEPQFFPYSDTVCTHVIESLSNITVCDNPIRKEYIKENIGPKAKDHWVAWEQFMGGPQLF